MVRAELRHAFVSHLEPFRFHAPSSIRHGYKFVKHEQIRDQMVVLEESIGAVLATAVPSDDRTLVGVRVR